MKKWTFCSDAIYAQKEWSYGHAFVSFLCPKLIELSNKTDPSSIRRLGGPLRAAKVTKMPKKEKDGPKVAIIGPLSGRNAGTEVGLKRDSMADIHADREAGRCGSARAVDPQNVLKSSKITPKSSQSDLKIIRK